MPPRHAICLVIDGLRASALGTYGNTSFPTPQFDALASRSLVTDWLWADSPHLETFYRSAWQGVHALRPEVAGQRASVLDQLQQAGVRQWLVTDEPWLIEQAGQWPFDEALLFETGAERAAQQIETTALGCYFAEVVEWLHQWREEVDDASSMAWLHCRGLHGPWDAPLDLRAELLEDEDPPPPEFFQPPTGLHAIEDPDVLLAHRVAYAAQIQVLDACVGALMQAVETVFAGSETLVLLAGSRGFALGEHGAIGADCTDLYSEQLHLPWLLHTCGNTTPLPRRSSLAQPSDIGVTLLDWWGVREASTPCDGISSLPALTGNAYQQRQLAVSSSPTGQRILRTPAWMLRQEDTAQLFTKPDDRWEFNDVAGLCPEVVNGLQRELTLFEQCCREEKPLPTTTQDEELIVSLR